MAAPRHGLLKHLAWWNVGLHLLALVLTWFFIRPGTEAFEYQVRCAYIAQSWLWSASWTVWMICALMQVAFYARLIGYLPKRRDTAMFALSLACVGVGIDLLCDVIWISILPVFAGVRADISPTYHALELLASTGGLVVANGLYSFAVLLFTFCMRREDYVQTHTLRLGYAVAAFGLLLSLAGLIGSHSLAVAMTGPTILCYCAWTVLTANELTRQDLRPCVA
jgi:hypothetical protein